MKSHSNTPGTLAMSSVEFLAITKLAAVLIDWNGGSSFVSLFLKKNYVNSCYLEKQYNIISEAATETSKIFPTI